MTRPTLSASLMLPRAFDALDGADHHIVLKLWVRQWIPGGRLLLEWLPWVPSIEQLHGARLVPREQYSHLERRLVPSSRPITMIELDSAISHRWALMTDD